MASTARPGLVLAAPSRRNEESVTQCPSASHWYRRWATDRDPLNTLAGALAAPGDQARGGRIEPEAAGGPYYELVATGRW